MVNFIKSVIIKDFLHGIIHVAHVQNFTINCYFLLSDTHPFVYVLGGKET